MKNLFALGVMVAFVLSIGACKKADEAAPAAGNEPAAAEPAKTEPAAEPAKAEPAAEPAKAEPAAEPAKAEPAAADPAAQPAAQPAAAGEPDTSAWPEVCKKLKTCADAWMKAADGTGKTIVSETWPNMVPQIGQAPAQWEMGCKTALESWAAQEGAPAECK